MKEKRKVKGMPICVNCIHAYVCEEYNLNRDTLRKRCAYHNDHFLDMEQHDNQVIKEMAKKIFEGLMQSKQYQSIIDVFEGNWFVSNIDIKRIAKQFEVEIKE